MSLSLKSPLLVAPPFVLLSESVSTAAALRIDALDIRDQGNPLDRTGNHAIVDSRTIGRFDQRQTAVFDNGRRPGRINL